MSEIGEIAYQPVDKQAAEIADDHRLTPEEKQQLLELAKPFTPDGQPRRGHNSLSHILALKHARDRFLGKDTRLSTKTDPAYESLNTDYYSYEQYGRHVARRKQVTQILMNFLRERHHSKDVIAELAAGVGIFAEEFRAAYQHAFPDKHLTYLPSDLAESALHILQTKGFEAERVSAESLPYQDNSMDVVYAGELIEHLPYDVFMQFLEESYRVLQNGGIVVLTTPNYLSLPARTDLQAGRLPLVFDESRDPWASEHLVPFTRKSLQESLRLQGFMIDTISTNQITWQIKDGVPVLQEQYDSMIDDSDEAGESVGDSLIVSARKVVQ